VGVVRSVRPLPAITRVPNVPSFFMGVANVRGVVLTLLDLRRFFDLPPADKLAELIVVTHGDLTLGLPVGRVLEVQTIPKDAINGLEEVRYTLGAYVLGRERLVILDADDILTDSRLIHTNEANHD
jgi:purine-binding chemotaxis protein CheW